MSMISRIIGVIILALALAGCGVLSPAKIPTQSIYALNAYQSVKAPRGYKTRKTLLVSLPLADPGFQTTKMVYINVPYKLKAFANSRWVSPPAQMILPILAQRVRHAGYFYAVVTPPFVGLTDYRLDTRLIALQQEFLQPISQEKLVIQANLVSNRTNRVVASRRFQAIVPAQANNAYSGVLAANKAAKIISAHITKFVIRNLRP